MKWLLWTQLVLVLASLAVVVVAMSTSRYGGMVALGSGLVVLLLIAGPVMGLVALKRKKGYIHAGIVLLAPIALALPSAFAETTEDQDAFANLPMDIADDMRRTLQWLNWSAWLIAAAAVLAVVSALLLFRRKES